MPIKYFSIADINIEVYTDFDYDVVDNFMPFFINKNQKKSDIKCKLINIDKPIKFNTNPISKTDFFKVYRENGKLYIENYLQGMNEPYSCIEIDKNNICYIYPNGINNYKHILNVFSAIGLEYIFIKNETIMLHSSYIKYNNKAILFSAPSGVGKSTQAGLWEKYECAEIINGDRAAIRNINGKWKAYGLPFAGSSEVFKNISSDISSIVVIRQGKENYIERLSILDSFKYIYSETITNPLDSEFINLKIDIINKLITEIPIYIFYCTPDKKAVEVLKNKLTEEGILNG